MEERITLTREQLYDLVWQKPITHLAAEYAISDVGLAKLCARYEIPTPPRGYWAKVEAGRAPRKPKLPASKERSSIELRISKPDADAAAEKDALAISVAEAKRPENRIVVAERLHGPCPLVKEAKATFDNAEPNDNGILAPPTACLDVWVSRGQLARALRIADALLKHFQVRGWRVAIEEGGTFVDVDDAAIRFSVEEVLEKHEVSEKPELEGGYAFHYNRQRIEHRPSGALSITIHERGKLWGHGGRRNWNESEKFVLEERLHDVVIGMLRLAAAVRADRERKERAAQEEAARRKRLEAALAEQRRLREELANEQAQVERLRDQAARWRESEDLRRFVEHAREIGALAELGIEGHALTEWSVWALQQADRLDPFVLSPASILDEAERIEHMTDSSRAYP
jgi:hypothetical protein